MLVLSRKRNEVIHLHASDGLVAVMVSDIRGDRVKLGFEAPAAVNIVRKELEGSLAPQPREAHGEKK